MRITRRDLLRAGTVTVALGGGALLHRATDQGVFGVGRGNAYALWRTWDRGGGIEPVVAAGVLAANAHDAQPWRFRVDTSGGTSTDGPARAVVEVYRDPARHLGAMDPLRREMHVSVGCAVENVVVTARARGYEPVVSLLPGAAEDLMARIELDRGPRVPGPLSEAVGHRRTNRFPYREGTRVPAPSVSAFERAVEDLHGVSVRWLTAADLQTFRDETVAATAAIIADPEQSRDSHAWFRHSWDDLQRSASGLTLDGSVSRPAVAAAAKVLPDLGRSANDAVWLSNTRAEVDTAPLAGVVVADAALVQDPADAPRAWLQAGRLWQRLHLAMTADDVAAGPLNQLAERADREHQQGLDPRFGDVLDRLAGPGAVPMMPFRAGVATRAAPLTPRRPLVRVVEHA